MNQNHYIHNLNMIGQNAKMKNEGNFTSRNNSQQIDDEFLALKRWIEQIPDDDESLHLQKNNPNQDESKFNHIYVQDGAWGSDIHEDLSILGTERTSELATEHCSDTKHCNSHKPQLDTRQNQPLYQFNIPKL